MAGVLSLHAEAVSRGARMLRTALGPAIAAWLEDPAVVEVMLNPDGRLWIDRPSEGLADTGSTLSAADGERIVRLRNSCARTGGNDRELRNASLSPGNGGRGYDRTRRTARPQNSRSWS
jgi:Flp pilus assembly CpaF family ATPase